MDYELAKQLKEAGFPQNTLRASVLSPWMRNGERTEQFMTREKGNNGYANLLSSGYDVVSLPTLEEVISALGAELFTLQCDDGKWDAIYGEAANIKQIKSAETAIEAVAMLWLALNPKSE